jgi:hypothetical protein
MRAGCRDLQVFRVRTSDGSGKQGGPGAVPAVREETIFPAHGRSHALPPAVQPAALHLPAVLQDLHPRGQPQAARAATRGSEAVHVRAVREAVLPEGGV